MTTNEENDQINDNNNIIGNISHSHLSKMRNEFLVTIKQVQKELTKKFDEQNKIFTSSMNDINEKINEFPKINSSLTEATANISIILDKLDDIESFKKKAETQLITHDIRLNNTIKDLGDSKFKYDKIFIDNLTLPGFIGPQSQFKTLSDYIYNNIQIVTNLSTLKDQMKDDLDYLKSKYENMSNDITILVGTIIDRCNNYSDNKDKILEDELKCEIKSNSEKIVEIRMQNAKDAIIFEKKNKELKDELDNNLLSIKSEIYDKNKELKENWDNILSIKEEIENKLNGIVESNNKENNSNNLIQKFEQMNFELVKIKNNVEKILKFINDLKLKNNNYKNINKNIREKLIKRSFDGESYNDSNKVISDEEEEYDKREKMHKLFHKISKKISFDDTEEINEKYNTNEKPKTHSTIKISNDNTQKFNLGSQKSIKDFSKLKYSNTIIQNRNNNNSENLMINSIYNRVGNNKIKENNSKFETLNIERNLLNQQSFKQIENNDNSLIQNMKKDNNNKIINNNNNNLRNNILNEKRIDYFEKVNKKYQKDLYLSIERKTSPQKEEKQKNEQIQINENSHNNNYNIYNQNSKIHKMKYYHRPSNSVVINTNNNNINNKYYYIQDQNSNEKINPLNIKNKKKYYYDNKTKEYDGDFNYNIIELEPNNIPQKFFIFKSIKSEKNINDNILGNQNKRRRQSVNNNMKFTKTFSPQGFHKEIIDCYGTTVYKKNINFNEQFPPSKNKLKNLNLVNPI